MNSFVICGPQSSGNRVLAAILIRAGLGGTSSTEQPKNYDVDWTQPFVVINHWERVREWVAMMMRHGHTPTLLMPIRETHAMASSMLRRGHDSNYEHALAHRNKIVMSNLCVAFTAGIRAELVVYEELRNPDVVRQFLKRHGLRFDNLEEPLVLTGQNAPGRFINQNAKHYEEIPCDCPAAKDARDSVETKTEASG